MCVSVCAMIALRLRGRMTDQELSRAYEILRREAELLVGSRYDLIRRVAVYHHLYRHSGGNHVFPLIAAHGALWANWYFRWGMRIGRILSLQYLFDSPLQKRRLADLRIYADAYRDINRRVCIETYCVYHFSRLYGHLPNADAYVPAELLQKMMNCHVAAAQKRELDAQARADLFNAFFLWEQDTIVAPAVEHATDVFYWPILKAIALRPSIRFAYFPFKRRLNFSYFVDKHERIEKGFAAYAIAEQVGLDAVEQKLSRYKIMPRAFHDDSEKHFMSMGWIETEK